MTCTTCGDSKTVWVKAGHSLDVAPCPDCTGEKEMLRPVPAISRRVAAACGSPTLQALFREDQAVHNFLVRFTEDARTWEGIPPIYRTLIEYAEKEMAAIPIDQAASDEMDAHMAAQHAKLPKTVLIPAWVLCSERMPPESSLVLAWSPSQGYFMVISDGGAFISTVVTDAGKLFTLPADISHWSLLPRPPHA